MKRGCHLLLFWVESEVVFGGSDLVSRHGSHPAVGVGSARGRGTRGRSARSCLLCRCRAPFFCRLVLSLLRGPVNMPPRAPWVLSACWQCAACFILRATEGFALRSNGQPATRSIERKPWKAVTPMVGARLPEAWAGTLWGCLRCWLLCVLSALSLSANILLVIEVKH